MYPMDFEEFLWATGNNVRWNVTRELFTKRKQLDDMTHRIMTGRFRQYLIVGGMPQVVMRHIETKGDFLEEDKEKRRILTLYRDDIQKHAGTHAYKVEAIFDKLEFNKGMLVENVIAQMLVMAGRQLFFFSKYDKSNASERMVVDFLIAKSKLGGHKNISPIEVKSSKNYATVSLDKFRRKYRPYIDTPYVLHTGDLSVMPEVTYLPLYMTPLL